MSDETREAGLLFGAIGQIYSPAGRWETLDKVEFFDKPGGSVRVWTDETGPDYSWRFTAFHALRFRALDVDPVRVLKIFETPEQIAAALAQPNDWAWPSDSIVLVSAQLKSHNGGWEVIDSPDGGERVAERQKSRAGARAAVRRACRVHAKSLRVLVHDDRAIRAAEAALRG